MAVDKKAALTRYRSRGLAARMGFGRNPAVLVIDLVLGFTDPSSPLGAALDKEVEATRRLIQAARSKNVPVLFSTVSYDDQFDQTHLFMTKVPSLRQLRHGSRWVEVDPRLQRRPVEVLLTKRFASCFFATHLASSLIEMRVDTLLITGCTTSGCVRASVVDALQFGFRPMVVLQCVGDRDAEAHAANLFDMEAKYADIVSLRQALAYLKRLPRKPATGLDQKG